MMAAAPTIPHPMYSGSMGGGNNHINLGPSPVVSSSSAAPQIPSPPEIIMDSRPVPGRPNGRRYLRGRILGKGGFAKCYEATDLDTRELWAVKIVAKASLVKQRAKVKLLSEIAIHKTLNHEKVVRYVNHFDDNDFVYIILELCPSQTLNDLLKKKRRFSEQEAQYYIYELVQGLIYLRKERVIHRDLKLGNLFLGAEMELKIGDFGLAAKLDYDEEKKTTICGTPNYIAPEILDNHQKGHSFQVDVWSLGVVMFTMLVGKPPFEDVDVKSTYQRIRDNAYAFPDNLYISSSGRNLIQSILRHDPKSRPTIFEIAAHPWFGPVLPPPLPSTVVAISKTLTSQQTPRSSALTPMGNGKDYARIDSPQLANSNSLKNLNQANTPRQPLRQQNNWNYAATTAVRRSHSGTENNENVSSRGYYRNMVGGSPIVRPPAPAAQPMLRSSYSRKSYTAASPGPYQAQQSPQVANPEEMFGPKFVAGGRFGGSQSSSLPEAWVVRWIDYSSKYGIGYMLSNGRIGVYFNDATKMVFASNTSSRTVEYLYRQRGARVDTVSMYSLDDEALTGDAKKKTTLIKNFKGYLQTTTEKEGCTRGTSAFSVFPQTEASSSSASPSLPLHIKRWMRTKHALVFQLSNKVWQVIFQDRTEVILSAQTHLCHYVSEGTPIQVYPLGSIGEVTDEYVAKRLAYSKQVVIHMLGGGASSGGDVVAMG
jgi:polo-like kinase 1